MWRVLGVLIAPRTSVLIAPPSYTHGPRTRCMLPMCSGIDMQPWDSDSDINMQALERRMGEVKQSEDALESLLHSTRDNACAITSNELRANERRETERRRHALELRDDLPPEVVDARRLSDAVALQEPSALPTGPSADLSPHDVVVACMVALQDNDVPAEVNVRSEDWGRRYNWGFFSGMVRANWRGDVEEFVREARNNPTGMANCDHFETDEDTFSVIAGTATRGAICKVVVHVQCRDAIPMAKRSFLWTLQQERRPPQAGCWLVTSVLAMDRALEQLTM